MTSGGMLGMSDADQAKMSAFDRKKSMSLILVSSLSKLPICIDLVGSSSCKGTKIVLSTGLPKVDTLSLGSSWSRASPELSDCLS